MNDDAVLFDRFRLSPSRRTLTGDGVRVPVTPRALDILISLADADGALLSSRDLLTTVWPGIHVDPGVLRVHISALRRVLGCGVNGEPLIQTIPGRGYRLACQLRRDASPASASIVVRRPRERVGRLFGRAELIADLCAELPRRQFLTLVGAGGVGKTSLALEIAAQLEAAYDQMVFADLATIVDSALVSRTVALAFGLTVGAEDPTPTLARYLSDGHRLLLLDNCEHVVEGAAELASRLCAEAPDLDILATSREPLRADRERIRRVPPLAVPALSSSDTGAYASVQMFVDRAQARRHDFVLTNATAAAVGEICRRLEGLPLAIELAASWCDVFTAQELAERLDGRLMLGVEERRHGPARQRSLRALIDWSHDLLTPPERRLFRRLSVFAGEFSLDNASAVAAEAPGGQDLSITLNALVAKSLVAATASADATVYHLLMAPRAYAADRLSAADETAEIGRRHLNWVRDELAKAEDRWPDMNHRDWVRRHAGLVGDIRLAGQWSLSDAGDRHLAVLLVCDATPLLFRLSLPYELRALVEGVKAAFADGGLSLHQQVRLEAAHGVALTFTYAAQEGARSWKALLEYAKDDPEHLMLGHWGLWLVAGFAGAREMGLAHGEAFRRLAYARGVTTDMATGERMLATARLHVGEVDAAREGFERALALLEEPRRERGVMLFQFDQNASILCQLAQIHWLEGRPETAVATAQAAVAAAEASGHSLSLSYALIDGLAYVAVLAGQPAIARAAISRHLGSPETRGNVVMELTDVLMALVDSDEGRPLDAVAVLERVFRDPSVPGYANRFPLTVGRVAEILAAGGRRDLGLRVIRDTRACHLTDPRDLALAVLHRAEQRILDNTDAGTDQ